MADGEPLLTIARQMGLARGTVRKFADAACFPERAVRAPGASILDPHLAHLEARRVEGCENAMVLWREVRERGFSGTPRQIHRWPGPRRTTPSKQGPQRAGQPQPARNAAGHGSPAPPSPKRLAWSLTGPRGRLNSEEAAALVRLEQDPEAGLVIGLVRRFADLVRGCGAHAPVRCGAPIATLGRWFGDATRSGVAGVTTFATGLQQDGAAVRAAVTSSWSNGQSEGQVSKLKMLKRQTFGRGSLDLLRRRALLAA